MKVYGWTDLGLINGHMVAAQVNDRIVEYHNASTLATRLGWLALFGSFSAAQAEMVKRMTAYRADDEAIKLVKKLKPGDVPLAEE